MRVASVEGASGRFRWSSDAIQGPRQLLGIRRVKIQLAHPFSFRSKAAYSGFSMAQKSMQLTIFFGIVRLANEHPYKTDGYSDTAKPNL